MSDPHATMKLLKKIVTSPPADYLPTALFCNGGPGGRVAREQFAGRKDKEKQ